MARKPIKPRVKTETSPSLRSRRQVEAVDLAQTTRGLVQLLDDLLTQNRDSLTLEYNSIDGIGTYLRIIDANLLSIMRGIDPDAVPSGDADIAA